MSEGADTPIMDDDDMRKADTKNTPKNTVDTVTAVTDTTKKLPEFGKFFRIHIIT